MNVKRAEDVGVGEVAILQDWGRVRVDGVRLSPTRRRVSLHGVGRHGERVWAVVPAARKVPVETDKKG